MTFELFWMVAQCKGRRPSKSRMSVLPPFSTISSINATAPTDEAKCMAVDPSEDCVCVCGGGGGGGVVCEYVQEHLVLVCVCSFDLVHISIA